MFELIKRMKDVQFYALMAMLVAAEGILVLAGVLPPLAVSDPVHTLFLCVRMAAFVLFGYKLATGGFGRALLKGSFMALSGMIVEVVLLFIGRMIGTPLLGIPAPNDFILYLSLLVVVVANVILDSMIVGLSAWFFVKLVPGKEKKKRRR